MKNIKKTAFFKNIKQVREFEFGVFYYFDGLVISEINEGVIFRWEMAKKVIKSVNEVLGEDAPVAYISNRINNYIVVPTVWIKFYKNRHQLNFYSVVGLTSSNFASIFLERIFFRNSIQKFTDLEEAINWNVEKIASE
jgi:hypothetical protein